MASHSLHGWVKRFWLFILITSATAFIANVSVQFILNGEIDLQRAVTLSLILGIVIALLSVRKRKAPQGP